MLPMMDAQLLMMDYHLLTMDEFMCKRSRISIRFSPGPSRYASIIPSLAVTSRALLSKDPRIVWVCVALQGPGGAANLRLPFPTGYTKPVSFGDDEGSFGERKAGDLAAVRQGSSLAAKVESISSHNSPTLRLAAAPNTSEISTYLPSLHTTCDCGALRNSRAPVK
jgi:hypothetical protein